MRPVMASIATTMRCSCRHAVLGRSGESVSKMGKISGMGFRFSVVVWVVPTTSFRKPYSHSSDANFFGEGIDHRSSLVGSIGNSQNTNAGRTERTQLCLIENETLIAERIGFP